LLCLFHFIRARQFLGWLAGPKYSHTIVFFILIFVIIVHPCWLVRFVRTSVTRRTRGTTAATPTTDTACTAHNFDRCANARTIAWVVRIVQALRPRVHLRLLLLLLWYFRPSTAQCCHRSSAAAATPQY
jgi:hypothetical protein